MREGDTPAPAGGCAGITALEGRSSITGRRELCRSHRPASSFTRGLVLSLYMSDKEPLTGSVTAVQISLLYIKNQKQQKSIKRKMDK